MTCRREDGGDFFLSHLTAIEPFFTLPSFGLLGLCDSAGHARPSPWDPVPSQMSVDTWQMAASLGVPWDSSCVASNPALAPSLNLYKSGEHHSPLPGDSFRTYHFQFKFCQRLSQWLSLTGIWQAEANRGRWERISGYLGPFAGQPPIPALVEPMLAAQLGPFQAHLGQERQAQTFDCFVLQIDWAGPNPGSIWHWSTPQFLPSGSEINTPSGELQTTTGQDPFSSTSSITEERDLDRHWTLLMWLPLVWLVHAQQLIHCGRGSILTVSQPEG